MTLRLNQRPQRLDHIVTKKRNQGYSVQNSAAPSKTAPTSAQLGNELASSQMQTSPFRALSLQNEMQNRYSTAADRYRTEVSNIVSQQSHQLSNILGPSNEIKQHG